MFIIRPYLVLFASHTSFCKVIFAAYVMTFGLILPLFCNDWAFSPYMSRWRWDQKATVMRVLEENNQAVLHSLNYLSQIEENPSGENKGTFDFVISVVTIRRLQSVEKTAGYLTRVLAGLHQSMAVDRSRKKALFICNVFAGPGPHQEAEMLAKNTGFTLISRFPNGSVSASIMDRFAKEKEDYMYCLQQASHYHPRYVLMVEDDALPHKPLFQILNLSIKNIETRHASDGPWAFLKLFYPERWQGYGFQFRSLLELMGVGCLGGSIFLAVFLCSRSLKNCRTNPVMERSVFFLGALYFMLLVYMIGRPYILEARRILPWLYAVAPAEDCCSPAILFPSDVLPPLLHYLEGITCTRDFAIDIALDEFVRTTKYKKFMVEPNLFKHIGLISTIKGISRHPEEFLYQGQS